MPVMDGRVAIGKLRADPEVRHIPIMAVSAIPEWETAGGDLAMCKPINESRFIDNMHLLLGDGKREPDLLCRFLILHEAGKLPSAVPESFRSSCEVSYCPIAELAVRLGEGFHGMVAIPTELPDRVAPAMLQSAPSLEVMIMPAGEEDMAAPTSTLSLREHRREPI